LNWVLLFSKKELRYYNSMKHPYAVMVKTAAQRYRAQNSESNSVIIKSDYDDLMKIARMIESNKCARDVARAMWGLDTIVRDAIPDVVYNAYNDAY
jgi:hypothetical protein